MRSRHQVMTTLIILNVFYYGADQLKAYAPQEVKPTASAHDSALTNTSSPNNNECQLWVLDVKPKPIRPAKAWYTKHARNNKVEGTIYVEVRIDEKGNVTSARIPRGLNPDYGLHESCLKAAKATKYTPAMKDGVKVKCMITYAVTFRLTKNWGMRK